MQEYSNKSVITNFVWRFAERSGAQMVSFVVTLVLARMLEPSAYGVVSLITVITNLLQVFVDSGMANALIQKKDADDLDFSTVFYFNMIMCSILYMCIFCAAPFIAKFYENEALTLMIRILSFTILISGVKNVQQAYVSRTMQFKKFFYATLGGTIGAALLGITMAYLGFGVWSLIAQQLFNLIVDTMVLWLTVKWRPKKIFSFQRLKKLFSYGWKLLISSLIDVLYNDIRQLIIGKMYSASSLAYYNKGQQFPALVVTNINSSINSVLMPTMSRQQESVLTIRNMTRRAIKTSTYIMAPLMIGLAVCASPLIRLVLTEKWMDCVPYLAIFCIIYMFYPIHTANLNAIKAMGRSDLFLKLEIEKKIVGLILLLATMRHGVMAMTYSLLATSFLGQFINARPNKKLLNYGYIEQLIDIAPGIVLALIMGVCIYPIQYFCLPDCLILIIMVLTGAGIYIGLSKILKIESFIYLCVLAKPIIKKMKILKK